MNLGEAGFFSMYKDEALSSKVVSLYLEYLPPAYVVRREGNSFTLFVCPHLGGVPISHNALQHFPECHEAAGGYPDPPPPGGLPDRVPPGGYPDPPRGGT